MLQKVPNPRASSWVLNDPNKNMIKKKTTEGSTVMMRFVPGARVAKTLLSKIGTEVYPNV